MTSLSESAAHRGSELKLFANAGITSVQAQVQEYTRRVQAHLTDTDVKTALKIYIGIGGKYGKCGKELTKSLLSLT